ncbi:response regulator [Chloracidobacterium validum]|uniref:histidine kinase n=1 Tax=Chloracidobacterium validum TaxID=2821543 RepID=A0ABX8B625_9BACT|nr:ATP-binding protein [Chloracidobacterium validum]QUW02422.1 response regulator [Chloracidobacterium validum]
MRVLLIEDDVAYATVAQGYLKRLAPEVECHHVTLLADGLSLAAAESFDVCLLDLNLPDSQGVATVAAMSAAAPTLPLIVLTAELGSDLDMQALQAGAEDYLAKSELGIASLRHAIRHAMERRRLARSLAQADQLNRLILDHMPASIELLDDGGRVQFINPTGLASLGANALRDVQGQDWLQLWTPTAAETLKSLLDQARGGQVATAQSLLARQGQALRWWNLKVVPVQGDAAPEARFLVVALDFTESRQQEERLRLAQKAELLSHIAGGIAHNFNNLLTVVQGYSEMMLRTLPEAETRQRRRANDIRKSAIRGHQLVERLLTYAHPGGLNPRPIDLNTLLEQDRASLEKALGPLVSLHFVLAKNPPYVHADPVLLLQVVITLLVNANDAMPDGGSVTICTDLIELDSNAAQRLMTTGRVIGDVTAWLTRLPAQFSLLSVSDTGVGMNAETLANIFTPFFTTKPVDEGTGLGLATVALSIANLGGFIRVESCVGSGSRFDIYLPASSGDSEVNGARETTRGSTSET